MNNPPTKPKLVKLDPNRSDEPCREALTIVQKALDEGKAIRRVLVITVENLGDDIESVDYTASDLTQAQILWMLEMAKMLLITTAMQEE